MTNGKDSPSLSFEYNNIEIQRHLPNSCRRMLSQRKKNNPADCNRKDSGVLTGIAAVVFPRQSIDRTAHDTRLPPAHPPIGRALHIHLRFFANGEHAKQQPPSLSPFPRLLFHPRSHQPNSHDVHAPDTKPIARIRHNQTNRANANAKVMMPTPFSPTAKV